MVSVALSTGMAAIFSIDSPGQAGIVMHAGMYAVDGAGLTGICVHLFSSKEEKQAMKIFERGKNGSNVNSISKAEAVVAPARPVETEEDTPQAMHISGNDEARKEEQTMSNTAEHNLATGMLSGKEIIKAKETLQSVKSLVESIRLAEDETWQAVREKAEETLASFEQVNIALDILAVTSDSVQLNIKGLLELIPRVE